MEVYNRVVSGEIGGETAATQFPNIACRLVWIKAQFGNAGNVYVGAAGVTKPDEGTDALTGIELDAGEMIGPLPISNLNLLYYICDNTGDDLTYIAVG